MIIGVDGNEANVKHKVGVSVYTLNLLSFFQKHANQQTQFKVFLKHPPTDDLPAENKYYRYQVVAGKFLWSQIFLPYYLFKNKELDIFFAPAHYGPRFLSIPLVVTIHDLSYLYYPSEFLKKDLYQLRYWTQDSLKKAKKIIAVSNTTKKDLINFYHLSEQNISVIHNGYERLTSINKSKFKVRNTDKPYVLYVGTLQPRKNIITLIKAFHKFNQIYPQFELIIAGKKGWLYEKIFDAVAELGIEDRVYFSDYVTDYQLVYLYENAFCLILPSYYEGFGLPILEAMNFDCPVISSFASSLPEVGGEACLYFDPQRISDLVEKMIKLKNDPDLRNKLIEKGKERIKQFSWKTCAEKTLNIITGVVKK